MTDAPEPTGAKPPPKPPANPPPATVDKGPKQTNAGERS